MGPHWGENWGANEAKKNNLEGVMTDVTLNSMPSLVAGGELWHVINQREVCCGRNAAFLKAWQAASSPGSCALSTPEAQLAIWGSCPKVI